MHVNDIDQNKHRAVLVQWNLNGKQLVTVKAFNVDLKHADKVRDGNPNRLVAPIKQYQIIREDITGWNVAPRPHSTENCIVLNNDPNMTFPIAPPRFDKPTQQSVVECINRWENDDPVKFWFDDVEQVTKIVEALNRYERERADAIACEALEWAELLKNLNTLQAQQTDAYLHSLGVGR